MGQSEDGNGTAWGAVNDEVSSHRPKQEQTRGEILATVAQARGLPEGFIPKSRRGRGQHRRREHNCSRAGFPALLGLALQSGAGRGGVNGLAAIEGGETAAELLVEFPQLDGTRGIVFFQKPQRFPYDLARRVVAAGFHFGTDEFFQFRREGNVHAWLHVLSSTNVAGTATIVNVCY